jgi:hypothetical protein
VGQPPEAGLTAGFEEELPSGWSRRPVIRTRISVLLVEVRSFVVAATG